MKIKPLIIIAFLIVAAKMHGQEKTFKAPDYNWIKEEIQKKDSKFNYKTQLERLKVCDTTLTGEEYRNLYYGNFFQSGYSAYSGSDDIHEKLAKYYRAESIDPKDYAEIIKLSKQVLNDDPFDLRIMNFLGYIYHLSGDAAMARKTSTKFHGIFEAILSSGDGRTCETGFHVTSVSHEYVLLNMFELQSKSQSLIGNCDYLVFEKGKYKIDGLYFNIAKLLEKEMEALGGK